MFMSQRDQLWNRDTKGGIIFSSKFGHGMKTMEYGGRGTGGGLEVWVGVGEGGGCSGGGI